jgi:hypothetical protein
VRAKRAGRQVETGEHQRKAGDERASASNPGPDEEPVAGHGRSQRSERPLSAYTILDQLRDQGFRAPLQVYRALDKLVEFGLVHRLESLNAFVACRHPDCEDHETIAFMICEKCGR